MTEYPFFDRKAERWGKDMASLWGSLNICPCLNYLELPCHSPGELLSISSQKIWGDIQEPHNNMAYLLVCTGDALEDRNYGVSLVWINSNQVRASTMEEAVRTLSTLHLQWTQLALCPSTPVQGLQSHTPSQGQAFGHPTSGKGGGELLWAD